MTHETMDSWANKMANVPPPIPGAGTNVAVRAQVQNRGNLIMEVAEKLRPWLLKMFESVRDENGMLMQPARIRAIALNVAQRIVNEQPV